MVISNISQGLGNILNPSELLQNLISQNQVSDNPSKGLELSYLQQDSVEISAEARSLWAQIQNGSNGSYTTISSFAAEISGSFRSQTVAQVRDIGGDGGAFALSSSQFNFSLSVNYQEMSIGNFSGDQMNLDPKTLEDYLILLQTLLENIGSEFSSFLQDPIGWLTDDGEISFENIEDFISNLSDMARNFIEGAASGNEDSLAFALQSVNISIEVSSRQISVVSGEIPLEAEPIVLDLDGDGIELTNPSEGIDFDITGDGKTERTAAPTGGDAFLALDRNGNGKIDNGTELFGDHHGAKNGFDELAKFDDNKDGLIDARDAIYRSLLLFGDLNNDGKTEKNEYKTLLEAGIESINLNYRDVNEESSGNRITESSSYTRNDGSTGEVVDTWLKYNGEA